MSSQDYIPWNAVATNWANRRAVWARRLRDCMDVSGVVKHLLQLEQEQPSPLIRVCPHQGAVCIASRLLQFCRTYPAVAPPPDRVARETQQAS